jgi:DNA polymerase sigma
MNKKLLRFIKRIKMNTKERMEYISNHHKIIQHYMNLHDEEVKSRKTLFQKLKELIKGK